MPVAVVDFGSEPGGYVAPRMTVERLASRLSGGEMLVRRWLGCWVDFAVLAVLFFVPVFIGEETQPWIVWIGLALALAYFPITEGRWGRSLGKLVTGTVVVAANGGKPGYVRAIIRTLLRLVEVNPFLFGGIPAGICVLATKDRRRIGDLAAGTYVIPYSELKNVAPDNSPVEVFE